MNYRQIVLEELQLPGNFFREYSDVLRGRLTEAARGIHGASDRFMADVRAINSLFDLAYKIRLLETPPERMCAAIEHVGEAYPIPENVVDASILRYLADEFEADPSMAETVGKIRKRLDDINWMTSPEIAAEFGFSTPVS